MRSDDFDFDLPRKLIAQHPAVPRDAARLLVIGNGLRDGGLRDRGVRDLPEVRATGFHFFASCVLVSHAYVHLVEVGGPVAVGGLTVQPGDLLHGDEHGVISIPHEIARELPKAAAEVERRERGIIEYARSPEVSAEGLHERFERGY